MNKRTEVVRVGKDEDVIKNYKRLADDFSTLLAGVSKGYCIFIIGRREGVMRVVGNA